MATEKIDVRNGMFITYHDGKATESKEVDINGYHGSVLNNGTIHFERVSGDRGVSGDIFPDGRFRFNNQGTIKRGQVTLDENSKVNGTFGLHTSTGSKYMYFRDAEFQDFLDTRGITAVSRQDPNGVFSGFVAYNAARGTADFYIDETDGKVEKLEHEDLRPESTRDENYTTGNDSYRISDATYVVIHSSEHYMDNHNSNTILYTMEKDVTKLNIPQQDFSKLHNERERFLNGEIDYGENVPSYVLKDRECAEYYVDSQTEISKEAADIIREYSCKQKRNYGHGDPWVSDPNDPLTIKTFSKTKELHDLDHTLRSSWFKENAFSKTGSYPEETLQIKDEYKNAFMDAIKNFAEKSEKDIADVNLIFKYAGRIDDKEIKSAMYDSVRDHIHELSQESKEYRYSNSPKPPHYKEIDNIRGGYSYNGYSDMYLSAHNGNDYLFAEKPDIYADLVYTASYASSDSIDLHQIAKGYEKAKEEGYSLDEIRDAGKIIMDSYINAYIDLGGKKEGRYSFDDDLQWNKEAQSMITDIYGSVNNFYNKCLDDGICISLNILDDKDGIVKQIDDETVKRLCMQEWVKAYDLKKIPPSLQSDKEFLMHALKASPSVYKDLSDSLKKDEDIFRVTFEKSFKGRHVGGGYAYQGIKELWEAVPEEMRSSPMISSFENKCPYEPSIFEQGKELLTKEAAKNNIFGANSNTGANAPMTKQDALNAFGDGKIKSSGLTQVQHLD